MIELSESQKAKLKDIGAAWLKEAAQENIVLVGGVRVENRNGKLCAVANSNADPLHPWIEPLD